MNGRVDNHDKKAITVKKIANYDENTPSKKGHKNGGNQRYGKYQSPTLNRPDSHVRSFSMKNISQKDMKNFDEVEESAKEKKDMEKKYTTLTNKVQALRKKEVLIENKMNAMKKKSDQIEEIRKEKNQFKDEVKASKELRQKQLKEQQQKIKNLRRYEHNRQITLQRMANQKKKLMLEINKADQNLMRTMLNQTHSKLDSNNRLKYLKEREHKEKNKKANKENHEFEMKYRKVKNKMDYEDNLNKTEDLRNKCKELEELETIYKNELITNKAKVDDIEHPSNYMKHIKYPNGRERYQTISSTSTAEKHRMLTPLPGRRTNKP